ncbi:MAG: gliding motility protein GldD [Saprospiraceae bacterium]|nr:gliding motility protein GldD [Saprospiraceae bacterium]
MNFRIFYLLSTIVFPVFLLVACGGEEELPIPKPRTYPKVIYPERNMTKLDNDYCNFTFEYPDYMVFEQDTTLISENAKHSCWFNLQMESLNGDIHFTYTDISGDSLEYNLYEIYKDAYLLFNKHNQKTTGKEDVSIAKEEENLYGILFNIEGHVACPFQVVLTDSTQHAILASLYFKSRPDPDSMAPVIEFVKKDIAHLVTTFEWKD